MRILISYRREDRSGYAGRLFDRLVSHFGETNVFMDFDSPPTPTIYPSDAPLSTGEPPPGDPAPLEPGEPPYPS